MHFKCALSSGQIPERNWLFHDLFDLDQNLLGVGGLGQWPAASKAGHLLQALVFCPANGFICKSFAGQDTN